MVVIIIKMVTTRGVANLVARLLHLGPDALEAVVRLLRLARRGVLLMTAQYIEHNDYGSSASPLPSPTGSPWRPPQMPF